MSKEHPKFQDIKNLFDTFIYRKDPYVYEVGYSTLLANQLENTKPVWLMLVAPPSSGKTTLINVVQDFEFTKGGVKYNPFINISDLTANSFASGMASGQTETSLLKRTKHGSVFLFKDFTSILSKGNDERRVVMGQMREIYDGAYVKRTGNGNDVIWKGHVGALAGVTESIYQQIETSSVMGDRFILYCIQQPDRREMLRFKLSQMELGITEETQMPALKLVSDQWLTYAMQNIHEVKIKIPKELEDTVIDIADFCTKSRSGIIQNDYTGQIIYVPEKEMPARLFEQMVAQLKTLAYMNWVDYPDTPIEELIGKRELDIVKRCAWGSTSVTRRLALVELAIYGGGLETAALATKTGYSTAVVGGWLEQLNALGIAEREVTPKGKNLWKMKPSNANVLQELAGVAIMEGMTLEEEDPNEVAESMWDRDKKAGLPTAEELENRDEAF